MVEQASRIRIEHQRSVHVLAPGTTATFGRGTGMTIRLGVNDPHVHRRTGSFRWSSGHWELHNDGQTATLEIHLDGGLEAKVPVGAHPFVIPWNAHGTVRVLTPTPYLLEFTTNHAGVVDDEVVEPESGTETVSPRTGLGLTPAEVQMLVALCEPRLKDPRLPAFTIPSTKDICARLSITPKRAEDLVDGLVRKLASQVDGVIGSNDGRAVNRRHRIAAFAIDARCVTVRDLRLLDQGSG